MTPTVAKLLEAAEQLPPKERAELAERLLESLCSSEPEFSQIQITEVRRRIAQVESGEVKLIPGEEALAHVRRILASNRKLNM